MNKRIKKKHRILSQGTKILVEDAIVISESTAHSLLSSTSSEPIKSRAIINADYEYPKIITGFELGDSPHDRICKMFRDAEAYWLKKAREENK